MIVWLSSYPRSGNTFFRVILNSVFDIKTYSIYDDPGDIGADEATTEIVGHAFLPKDFDLEKARASSEVYYIKTHELLENMVLDDSDKVIYLVRDGRESTVSFAKHRKNYFGKSDDLTDVIYGNTPFKFWGEHVQQWNRINNQLLIKFEELTTDPASQLEKIANYLNIHPQNNTIPTFDELQKINPTFFRSGKNDSWKSVFTDNEHIAFWLRNYESMIKFNYKNDMPDEVKDDSFKLYKELFSSEIQALENNVFIDQIALKKNEALEEQLNQARQMNKSILDHIEKIQKLSFLASPIKKFYACRYLLNTLYQERKNTKSN